MNGIELRDAVRVVPRSGSEPPALDLVDDIEGVRAQLSTSRRVRPARCPSAQFRFPVDVAYELSPLAIWTNQSNPVLVQGDDGLVCAELAKHEHASLSARQHTVDIASLGLKVYLRVEGEIEISHTDERGRIIDCRGAETVQLGLRSFHDAPAATVTTTDQPRDVMRALSCLGSALKTTSCERSFPTLRGHPPLFERGECFQAATDLERTKETASVRIEVPPTLETIYPVAPLAYYLNAVVIPGESPRLVAGDSTIPLDRGEGLEHGVARLLKHVFTLDCITRTEGLYQLPLGERTALEERLSDTIAIDFATLHERSLAKQVQEYLSVPFDLIEDLVPRWPVTADVRPVGNYLPYLPFVVASLGTIRCLPMSCPWSPPSDSPEIEAFYRAADHATSCEDETRSGTGEPLVRSGSPTRSSENSFDSARSSVIHSPPSSESIAQLWLADGYPMQGTKPILSAFERRFDQVTATEYEVAVISNDVRMEAESDVAELYGQREQMDFEVTIREQLSCADLRELFAEEYDLVHYVGHVDADGLQCEDGWLDACTLETVNTRMFVLNGCRSYEQGKALVERGAVSGLCTLANIGNTPATQIGRTVARLLNGGFSLSGVLDIISEDFLTGQQYMIVGDPSRAVVKRHDGTSILAEITSASDGDEFLVDIHGYPTIRSPVGMLYAPAIDEETFYLNSGHMTTVTASRSEIKEYLHHDRFPVRINGSFMWSDVVSLDSIE